MLIDGLVLDISPEDGRFAHVGISDEDDLVFLVGKIGCS